MRNSCKGGWNLADNKINISFEEMWEKIIVCDQTNNGLFYTAVKTTIGKNHLRIVIPCHRIYWLKRNINRLCRKEWLLQHDKLNSKGIK